MATATLPEAVDSAGRHWGIYEQRIRLLASLSVHGLSNPRLVALTGISVGSITRIRRTESYKRLVAEHTERITRDQRAAFLPMLPGAMQRLDGTLEAGTDRDALTAAGMVFDRVYDKPTPRSPHTSRPAVTINFVSMRMDAGDGVGGVSPTQPAIGDGGVPRSPQNERRVVDITQDEPAQELPSRLLGGKAGEYRILTEGEAKELHHPNWIEDAEAIEEEEVGEADRSDD